jgi:hypothetical protein
MGRKAKWTEESAAAEALKYTSVKEFMKGSGGVYAYLRYRGLLKKYSIHMKRPDRKWGKESAAAEALKYTSVKEFIKGSGGAYAYLRYRGLLEEMASHLELKNILWNEKILQEEALKYENRGAFQKGSKNAYSAAVNKGLLDKVCDHMVELKKPQDYWTYEKLAEEALKYEIRSEFYYKSNPAYQTAFNKGILDEICVHMPPGVTGFDKSKAAILYYLRINSGEAYKIGITNRSVQDRFSVTDLVSIEIIQEWHYKNGSDAYQAEQNILQSFKYAKYAGDPLLENGNTELFYYDILGLDTKIAK